MMRFLEASIETSHTLIAGIFIDFVLAVIHRQIFFFSCKGAYVGARLAFRVRPKRGPNPQVSLRLKAKVPSSLYFLYGQNLYHMKKIVHNHCSS
jgi:hypothetical protein